MDGAKAQSGEPNAPVLSSWRGRASRGLRALLPIVLLVAIVPFGSVGPFAQPLMAIAVGVWSAGVFVLARSYRSLSTLALIVAAGLAAYILLQAGDMGSALAPHPIWERASALLGGPLPETVSVAPGRTRTAIPAVVAPFLCFAAVLLLYRTDERAVSLLRFLAIAGAGLAAFGIAQHFLAPRTLLLVEKRSYFSSLTAVFVNRNTTATFLGCTTLLLVGFVGRRLGGRSAWRTFLVLAIESGKARREWRLLIELCALAVVVVALLLTKSRGGIGATGVSAAFLAFLLSAPEVSQPGRRRRRRRGRWPILRRLGVSSATVAAASFVLWLFGGQTLLRVTQVGFEDSRFCVLPGMWQAARDAWPSGTGVATFDLVFPAYRNPDCGIYGVWDRAHNFFLEGVVTLGVAFVAAALVSYAALGVVLIRGLLWRHRERFAPAVGLSVVVLLTIHDLVDFSLQIPGFAVWCAALLGACVAIALRRPLRPVVSPG